MYGFTPADSYTVWRLRSQIEPNTAASVRRSFAKIKRSHLLLKIRREKYSVFAQIEAFQMFPHANPIGRDNLQR